VALSDPIALVPRAPQGVSPTTFTPRVAFAIAKKLSCKIDIRKRKVYRQNGKMAIASDFERSQFVFNTLTLTPLT
jgi:hypothetical protein